MSLGQRMNGNTLDKGGEEREKYESLIRQLKLLSKSQTALLKAHLSRKLKEAEEVVAKAADYIDSNDKPDARKAKDIRQSLKNLNLQDLEVDVSSTQVNLQRELTMLRAAIDNNGSLPGADASASGKSNGSSQPSAETNKLISTLETDNNKLRELLKEAQRELSSKPPALPPAAPAAAGPTNAELNRYKQEVELLKDQIGQLNATAQDKDNQISQQAVRIDDLNKRLSDNRKESALNEELSKVKAQLVNAESQKAQAAKDAEAKYNAKVQQMTAESANKVKELETSFAAEREEMELALVQELEELEKGKDEEIAVLEADVAKMKGKLQNTQRANQSIFAALKKLSDAAKAMQREQKMQARDIGKELADFSGAIRTQYAAGIVGKLRGVNEEMRVVNARYRKEMLERKRLHNLVQELKGNIRVYMRCRPPTTKELDQFGNDALCVSFPNPGEVRVVNEKNREKLWEFDEVFDTNTTQRDVYEDVSALVTSVLDGFNVCIFAYGQTGSGKTFTMSGPPDNRGVNTRALEELFSKVRDRNSEYNDSIKVSMLEVYNEDIHDLLTDSRETEKLEVKMGEFGNHVPGLTQVTVESIDAVFQLITVADRNRSQTATNMNEHSSRSHMMMTVTIVSEFLASGATTRGKLNLVDLAGSERINKSGAQGQALKEAQNINKSLSALGDVIAARAQKNSHIPFRNSTLTFLLQDCLSQDSKTLMIVCVSPVLYNAEETFCSLNFAARVRTVELGKASKITVASGGGGLGGGSQKSTTSATSKRSSLGGK